MNKRVQRQVLCNLFLIGTALINQGQSFGIGISPIATNTSLHLIEQQQAVLASHPELTIPHAAPISITGTLG